MDQINVVNMYDTVVTKYAFRISMYPTMMCTYRCYLKFHTVQNVENTINMQQVNVPLVVCHII
jgi:hypothetical protein